MNFLDEKGILDLEKKQKLNIVMAITFFIVILVSFYIIYSILVGKIINYSDISLGLPLLFGGFAFVFFYFLYKFNTKKLVNFWFRFAEINKGEYEPFKFSMESGSLVLKDGDNRTFEHIISFKNLDNGLSKIFSYNIFRKENGSKDTKHYSYWVFNFKYKGKSPHIYLDYMHDGFRVSKSLPKRIFISEEFDREFKIFTPEKYEIEALDIFSPSILNFILDSGIKLDIEIVDGDMFFFVRNKGMFNKDDLVVLQDVYNKTEHLFTSMKEKMDRVNFSKIGNLSEYL